MRGLNKTINREMKTFKLKLKFNDNKYKLIAVNRDFVSNDLYANVE